MSSRPRTIVVGVASVHEPDPVLRPALELAANLGAAVHLVHAFSLSDPGLGRYARTGAAAADAIGLLSRDLRSALEHWVHALRPAAPVHCTAVPGPAADVIADAALAHRAGLVVVGATRRGALARTILGTTCQQVIRASTVPVLMLRRRALWPVRRVLLTTDLSALSGVVHERGEALARVIAGREDPELRSLYVMGDALPVDPSTREAAEHLARQEHERFLRGRDARPDLLTARLRQGDPAKEIVAEAMEWEADLLVLGTRARRGATRLLLGSTAEATLRSALCNALVVPAASTRRPWIVGEAPRAADLAEVG